MYARDSLGKHYNSTVFPETDNPSLLARVRHQRKSTAITTSFLLHARARCRSGSAEPSPVAFPLPAPAYRAQGNHSRRRNKSARGHAITATLAGRRHLILHPSILVPSPYFLRPAASCILFLSDRSLVVHRAYRVVTGDATAM